MLVLLYKHSANISVVKEHQNCDKSWEASSNFVHVCNVSHHSHGKKSSVWHFLPGPYKTFFMLSSAELEILTARKF